MGTPQPRLTLLGNSWAEGFTIVSVRVFAVLWVAGLSAVLWAAWGTAPPALAVGLVLAGWAVWTFCEYALHRWVFHWEPSSAPLRKFVFIMHGNHHAVPNDPLRNLMPPIVSVPVALLIGLGLVAAIGAAGLWLLLGFLGGYVFYDAVHYTCHQRPLKGRLGRVIKQHHMRHHHSREAGNYAITGMMWDRLLSTRVAASRR